MKPKGNGLITLHDEKQEERGFFCSQRITTLIGMNGSQRQRTGIALIKTNVLYMKEQSRKEDFS